MSSTQTRRRWVRGSLAILVILLVAGGTGAWLLVEVAVDADFLQGLANDLLARTGGGLYRVQIGGADKSLMRGSLVARDVRLSVAPEARSRLGEQEALPALRFELQVDEVGIGGVDLLRLAWSRDLVADRFFVESPRIRLLADDELVTRPPSGNADGTMLEARPAPQPGNTTHQRMARALPRLHVQRVAIENVALSLESPGDDDGSGRVSDSNAPSAPPSSRSAALDSPPVETIEGISIHLENLRVDPSSAADPERVLYSDDVRLEVQRYARLLGDGDHELEVGPISASTRDGTFRFDTLVYRPTVSETEFLARSGGPDDRIEVELGPVRVTGMQYHRLIERLHLVADTVAIERFDLSMLEDERKSDSEPDERPGMPHDFFQSLGTLLHVEAVELGRGRVTYAERAPDGSRPGRITFSEIRGRITNVTNDPDRMGPKTPAVAELRSRVEGAATADLELRWELPLLSPRPTMFYRGRLEQFDARLFNSLLPDLEGMRITDGRVEWLEFDVQVGTRLAAGGIAGVYEDLSVSFEDKVTGERSLGDRLRSFAANTLVIRGDSEAGPDGRAEHMGRIEYRLEPDDPFFAIVWKALRSGLLDLIER